jgi:hypothetical protein
VSLTFNLVLALFLLAPGLGIFAGVYAGGRRPFSPSPAEPGSIHALALVAMGALLCHAVWAWTLAWMEAQCATHVCRAVGFEPNPYKIILELRTAPVESPRQDSIAPRQLVDAADVAWLFTVLLLTGISGFIAGRLGVATIGRTGLFRATLYGWIDELLSGASTKAHVFTAYVVTDTERNGDLLGYQGSLVDLRQSASGEIRAVVLKECQPFVLRIEDGVGRVTSDRETPIPLLMLEGTHIRNIAFRVYLDPDRLSDRERRRLEAAGELEVLD